MARTFSGTYSTTQVLSNPTFDNPATVTSTGLIVVNSPSAYASGIFGNSGFAWTLTNLGTVESVGSQGFGIQLNSGGVVTNGASGSGAGLIEGSQSGLIVNGAAGTISNFGSVISSASSGTAANAIAINAGGILSNYGLIEGGGNVNASVGVNNASGTVHNFGTITTTTNQSGVNLNAGGVVTNAGIISSAGANGAGVFVSTGTVANTGTVSATGTNSTAIGVGGGGSVTNSGLVSGIATGVNIGPTAGTVSNSGTIASTGSASFGSAIQFGTGGGAVVNGTTGSPLGLITAYHDGIAFFPGTVGTPGTVTVVNYGTIQSTQTGTATGFTGFGLQMNGAATVSNFGTISAAQTNGGAAILLNVGGSVTNGASGSTTAIITAPTQAIGVNGSAGTIVNFGTVAQTGTTGFQAISLSTGTVTNLGLVSAAGTNAPAIGIGTAGGRIANGQSGTSLGLITAYQDGIGFFPGTVGTPGTVTVVNYGTIRSTQTGSATGFTGFGLQMNGAATVSNFGTISAAQTNGGAAILLQVGGSITNGASGSTAALITAPTQGIQVNGSAGTIVNFGTISGTNSGTLFGGGIGLSAGGTITNLGTVSATGNNSSAISLGTATGTVFNGQSGSTLGMIAGYVDGIGNNSGSGPSTVVNYGVIRSTETITPSPTLFGFGVVLNSGTVRNFGTIAAAAQTNGVGAQLNSGGIVTNGATGSTTAVITASAEGVALFGSPGTLVNFGTISATGSTGTGVNITAGGSVTNGASGSGAALIQAGGTGINLGGGGTITNLGTVSSTGTNGIAINIGAAGGRIVNGQSGTSLGLITAYHIGVGFFPGTAASPGTLTVVNYGKIQSTQTAPAAGTGFNGFAIQTGSSTSVIDNFGTIAGSQTARGGGILLGGGQITNEAGALIDGAGGNAITTLNGGAAVTVTNFGTVRNDSTTNGVIYLGLGGSVTNGAATSTSAAIIGSGTAGNSISIHTATGTVTNFGTVANAGTFSNAVYLGAGGSVTNAASGTIVASWVGVDLKNVAGTVSNLGTIESTATFTQSGSLKGAGVLLQQGGTVVNGASGSTSGLIQGYELGVYIGGGGGTPNSGAVGLVFNYGTIASVGTGANAASAAELSSGGTITNHGTIESIAGNAITLKGTVAGSIVNFGVITQTGTGTSGEAVYLGAGGTVTNYGLISGAHPGSPVVGGTSGGYPGVVSTRNQPAAVVNLGTITNPNNSNGVNLLNGGLLINGSSSVSSALINGPRGGIYIGGNFGVPISGAIGTVVNYGTIQNSSSASQAVRIVSGGTVNNHGLISSARTGISFGNTAGTIDNFGSIVSTAPTSFTAGTGVYLQSGGSITNEAGASITALRAAVSLGGTTSAGAVVSNSGTLTGNVGVNIGTADTGNNTIVNFGTITGTNGIAIMLGAGNDRVVIEPGSVLQGAVANFHPGDTFDLPGLAFNSAGSVILGPGNVLQVTENSTTFAINLDPSQNFAGDFFALAPDSGSGALIGEAVGMLSGQTALSAATEHVALGSGTPVATFTSNNPADVASGFTAAIDWGDGAVTPGVVSGSSGSFTVSGGHTYADEGSDPLSVTLTRTSDAVQATAAGTVTVGENDALTPHGAALAATAGQALNNVMVASFSDTDTVSAAGDFAATIDWGDGTATPGTVSGSSGSFAVSGSHTYAGPGTPTVTVTLADDTPGTATATATSAATIAPPIVTSLFDFVFTYADGKDYYGGTVADNGVFGYVAGQRIVTSAGHYDIFGREAGSTPAPSGTVVVASYSHGGPGAASPVPLDTAAGRPDGTGGLGSESDAVLGTDGMAHPFSATQEASFGATTALFGFVYSYADGAAFYSGSVADDGTLSGGPDTRPVSDPNTGAVLGTYSIFRNGVTTLAPGSVVIDRFTTGDASFMTDHAGAGVADGSAGLGSEVGGITVDGVGVGFSADQEPRLTLSVPTVPAPPVIDPADVITAEVTEIYRDVLGRNPDPGGLATFSAELAGGTSVAAVRQQFAASPEAQSDVNALYRQVLGRDADAGGLATYTGFLANGSSLSAVQLILAQSGEAQNDIAAIYQDVLGRAPDGGGLVTFMAALAGGTSLAAVRGMFAHSLEAANDLTQLFQGILGRQPGAAELVGMEDQLAGSATQQTLQSALQTSGTAGGFTTVTATAGDAALTAPPATPTLFVFGDIAFGLDTIAGFDPTRDTIQIAHARVADLTTLANDTAASGTGTLITLNPNQSIQIAGIPPTKLGPPNFQIL